eukprot:12460635-Alexandrium_andersonii.AAC.1
MHEAVRTCVTECGWRIRALLRARRYHTNAELVQLYKSHVLAYVEYRTAAPERAREGQREPEREPEREPDRARHSQRGPNH